MNDPRTERRNPVGPVTLTAGEQSLELTAQQAANMRAAMIRSMAHAQERIAAGKLHPEMVGREVRRVFNLRVILALLDGSTEPVDGLLTWGRIARERAAAEPIKLRVRARGDRPPSENPAPYRRRGRPRPGRDRPIATVPTFATSDAREPWEQFADAQQATSTAVTDGKGA